MGTLAQNVNSNSVHLIGSICTLPNFEHSTTGKSKGSFSLLTTENFINERGELKTMKSWHRVVVYGRNAMVINQLAQKGTKIAIEGKLRSKFFHTSIGKQFVMEVEANDLVLI